METKRPLLIIAVLLLCFYACKKDGNKITPLSAKTNTVSIIGKWNIVVDSTSGGVGSINAFAVYTGQRGDYFSFGANGYVYTKEGTTFDVLKYNLLSDSTLTIQSFVYTINGLPQQTVHIKNLSTNTIAIYLPWFLSPGGAFGRSIVLSR